MNKFTLLLSLAVGLSACSSSHLVISSNEVRQGLGVDQPTTFPKLPTLQLRNIKEGKIIRVECDFQARNNKAVRSNGFYYSLSHSGGEALEVLTPNDAIFQGSTGWQTAGLCVYFRALVPIQAIDFQLQFEKRDVNGHGQVGNVQLSGEVLNKNAVRFN